jgi:hypothetical protein
MIFQGLRPLGGGTPKARPPAGISKGVVMPEWPESSGFNGALQVSRMSADMPLCREVRDAINLPEKNAPPQPPA